MKALVVDDQIISIGCMEYEAQEGQAVVDLEIDRIPADVLTHYKVQGNALVLRDEPLEDWETAPNAHGKEESATNKMERLLLRKMARAELGLSTDKEDAAILKLKGKF